MARFLIRSVAFLAILAVVNVFVPSTLEAWGPEGHEVVGLIAANHLTPRARQGVSQLLGGQTLASVANFADQVRGARPETAPLHFVDIEITDNNYVPARDCREVNGHNDVTGDCVIEAIKHYTSILADSHQPRAKRAEAVKFVVHFVGDLHQPLHDADNHDRGGNNVRVTFFGQSTNLHSVWDGGIITKHGLNSVRYAAELEHAISPGSIPSIQQGSLEDWAVEAHHLAVSNAYVIPANHVLGNAYFNTSLPVVSTQLTRAGLRLAKILNDVFK